MAYQQRTLSLKSELSGDRIRDQGKYARVDRHPITANPWFTPENRAKWEAGWQEEHAAQLNKKEL